MVDINLIGDDKTGEEDRVEDFTQTSSMDTQELAFEERTETFDTTKTAGFAQKRSYSSLVSTLIVLVVVVLLGGAVYFFMFGDDNASSQADLPSGFDASLPDNSLDANVNDPELDQLTQDFAQDLADANPSDQSGQLNFDEPAESTNEPIEQFDQLPEIKQAPVVNQPAARQRTTTSAPPRRNLDLTPVSSDFLASSRGTIQGVTNILTSMPTNLNTTLLSYTGSRLRLEFVANTTSAAKDFTNRLNQYLGSGNFSVVSETQVAANGGALEKVLISGTMGTNGTAPSNSGVRFLSLAQAKDWIRRSAQDLGLSVREITTQPGSFASGYQKVPILVRLYGTQSSLIAFLGEIAAQSYNIELPKVLLVSPDMITYSDDNLILVLNMFLYEQS